MDELETTVALATIMQLAADVTFTYRTGDIATTVNAQRLNDTLIVELAAATIIEELGL